MSVPAVGRFGGHAARRRFAGVELTGGNSPRIISGQPGGRMLGVRCLRFFAALLAVFVLCATASAQVKVRGYTRKDGTYVRPHYRSKPDGVFENNWTTYGNVN